MSDSKHSIEPNDTRHKQRVRLFQALYAHSARSNAPELTADDLVAQLEEDQSESESKTDQSKTDQSAELSQLLEKLDEIDQKIIQHAPAWPIEQMDAVNRAILQLGVYELMFTEIPPKVILNEAIEIAKEFGNETSYKLVNAVLATIAEESAPLSVENSETSTS